MDVSWKGGAEAGCGRVSVHRVLSRAPLPEGPSQLAAGRVQVRTKSRQPRAPVAHARRTDPTLHVAELEALEAAFSYVASYSPLAVLAARGHWYSARNDTVVAFHPLQAPAVSASQAGLEGPPV